MSMRTIKFLGLFFQFGRQSKHKRNKTKMQTVKGPKMTTKPCPFCSTPITKKFFRDPLSPARYCTKACVLTYWKFYRLNREARILRKENRRLKNKIYEKAGEWKSKETIVV